MKCWNSVNLLVTGKPRGLSSALGGHSTTTWTRWGGGGVSQKSTLVHSGGGGPLNVHVDQNLAISEGISYYCLLCIVMGGKKEIKLHWMELTWTQLNWFKSYCHWKLKVCENFDILEGGGFCPPLVHVDKGGGDVNVHACPLEGGRGSKLVKIWST